MMDESAEGYTWKCDSCGLVAEFPPFDFWRAVNELKARGWSFWRTDEGGWQHSCGKCARNERERSKNLMSMPVVKPIRKVQ